MTSVWKTKKCHKDLEYLKAITWGAKIGKLFQAHVLWHTGYRVVMGNISIHLDIPKYTREAHETSGRKAKDLLN